MHQIPKLKKQKMRYGRRLSEYWILSTVFCLTGCMGVYDGGFECPPGEGVGCKSISAVNQMVNEGEIPKEQGERHATTCAQCGSNPPSQKDASEDLHIWYSPWALGAI